MPFIASCHDIVIALVIVNVWDVQVSVIFTGVVHASVKVVEAELEIVLLVQVIVHDVYLSVQVL